MAGAPSIAELAKELDTLIKIPFSFNTKEKLQRAKDIVFEILNKDPEFNFMSYGRYNFLTTPTYVLQHSAKYPPPVGEIFNELFTYLLTNVSQTIRASIIKEYSKTLYDAAFREYLATLVARIEGSEGDEEEKKEAENENEGVSGPLSAYARIARNDTSALAEHFLENPRELWGTEQGEYVITLLLLDAKKGGETVWLEGETVGASWEAAGGVDLTGQLGATLLNAAFHRGREDIVGWLLDHGADPTFEVPSRFGEEPASPPPGAGFGLTFPTFPALPGFGSTFGLGGGKRRRTRRRGQRGAGGAAGSFIGSSSSARTLTPVTTVSVFEKLLDPSRSEAQRLDFLRRVSPDYFYKAKPSDNSVTIVSVVVGSGFVEGARLLKERGVDYTIAIKEGLYPITVVVGKAKFSHGILPMIRYLSEPENLPAAHLDDGSPILDSLFTIFKTQQFYFYDIGMEILTLFKGRGMNLHADSEALFKHLLKNPGTVRGEILKRFLDFYLDKDTDFAECLRVVKETVVAIGRSLKAYDFVYQQLRDAEERARADVYTGMSQTDIRVLDKMLQKPVDISICPICLSSVERPDGCLYMEHDCRTASNFYHWDLYNKYRSDSNGTITWCTMCSRVCKSWRYHNPDVGRDFNAHRHYKLVSYEDDVPALVDPAAIGHRENPFDRDCTSQGGGGLIEKLKRVRMLRRTAQDLEAQKGKTSDYKARAELVEAMWNSPFERNKKEVEAVLAEAQRLMAMYTPRAEERAAARAAGLRTEANRLNAAARNAVGAKAHRLNAAILKPNVMRSDAERLRRRAALQTPELSEAEERQLEGLWEAYNKVGVGAFTANREKNAANRAKSNAREAVLEERARREIPRPAALGGAPVEITVVPEGEDPAAYVCMIGGEGPSPENPLLQFRHRNHPPGNFICAEDLRNFVVGANRAQGTAEFGQCWDPGCRAPLWPQELRGRVRGTHRQMEPNGKTRERDYDAEYEKYRVGFNRKVLRGLIPRQGGGRRTRRRRTQQKGGGGPLFPPVEGATCALPPRTTRRA